MKHLCIGNLLKAIDNFPGEDSNVRGLDALAKCWEANEWVLKAHVKRMTESVTRGSFGTVHSSWRTRDTSNWNMPLAKHLEAMDSQHSNTAALVYGPSSKDTKSRSGSAYGRFVLTLVLLKSRITLLPRKQYLDYGPDVSSGQDVKDASLFSGKKCDLQNEINCRILS
jgi:hypothetical protein